MKVDSIEFIAVCNYERDKKCNYYEEIKVKTFSGEFYTKCKYDAELIETDSYYCMNDDAIKNAMLREVKKYGL